MKAHLEHPKVTFYYACAKPVVAEKQCLSTPSYDNLNCMILPEKAPGKKLSRMIIKQELP
jgi:hypothetical protein